MQCHVTYHHHIYRYMIKVILFNLALNVSLPIIDLTCKTSASSYATVVMIRDLSVDPVQCHVTAFQIFTTVTVI